MLERRLRLVSGLVLALFVTLHLVNVGLGIGSFELMETGGRLHALLWQNPAGTVVLYGALLTHFALALRALLRRRTLRMPAWEAVQLGFGLSVPLLLAGHVAGTRVSQLLLGIDVDYPFVVSVLWSDAWGRVKQPLLLLIAWTHLAVGLHFWLRLRPWYPRAVGVLYALAIAVPLVALLGYLRAGLTSAELETDPAWTERAYGAWESAGALGRARVHLAGDALFWTVLACYALVLAAREVRARLAHRRGSYRVEHSGGRTVTAPFGQSVLEALRSARIRHASVCGGRARCTTCRVRIDVGLDGLPAPTRLEAAALARIGAAPNVRLACQLRPRHDLRLTPLLPPDPGPRGRGGVQGHEQRVAALFVDLRDSTALAEGRLPYDVVFVLNRFFEEMSAALAETNGHYAQFAGDGLLALYGLHSEFERGCRDALRGTVEIARRLAALNAQLGRELPAPLRVGMGLHAGDAIVGTMGPPSSPNLSAVGDNVNVAARLEQQSKTLGCALVVSGDAADGAGLDLADLPSHRVTVRGRVEPIIVFAVADPLLLAPRLSGPSPARPAPDPAGSSR